MTKIIIRGALVAVSLLALMAAAAGIGLAVIASDLDTYEEPWS